MTKFKVGDTVRVKSLEWYNENKNERGFINSPYNLNSDGELGFNKEMSSLCGKTFIISSLSNEDNYNLKGRLFSLSDWMLENYVVNSAEFTASLSPINANKTNIITVNPLLCSVDWNQYRFDLIKAVLPALVQGNNSAEHCAKKSIEIADEVIKILKDEKNISDGIQ